MPIFINKVMFDAGTRHTNIPRHEGLCIVCHETRTRACGLWTGDMSCTSDIWPDSEMILSETWMADILLI